MATVAIDTLMNSESYDEQQACSLDDESTQPLDNESYDEHMYSQDNKSCDEEPTLPLDNELYDEETYVQLCVNEPIPPPDNESYDEVPSDGYGTPSDYDDGIDGYCKSCKYPNHIPKITPNMDANDYMEMLNDLSINTKCFVAQRKYTKYFSWVLFNWTLIDIIADAIKGTTGPVIEVCAGAGWLSYFINAVSEVKVTPSDICVQHDQRTWFKKEYSYAPIEIVKLGAIEHVQLVQPAVLLLSYPDYGNNDACQTIIRFVELGGEQLIYYGEMLGGCCANDNFFDFLSGYTSTVIDMSTLPCWWGLHNQLVIYHFKKPKYSMDIVDPRTLSTAELNGWIASTIPQHQNPTIPQNEMIDKHFDSFEDVRTYICSSDDSCGPCRPYNGPKLYIMRAINFVALTLHLDDINFNNIFNPKIDWDEVFGNVATERQ